MSTPPTTVVFDIGNVLIGWDPRNLYRKLFVDRPDEMEWFLANVTTNEWNLEQDRGRSFAEAVALLLPGQPEHLHDYIRAYHERWMEMLSGEIAGTVAILDALHAAGIPLYAITNWNQDQFRLTRAQYRLFERFQGIVVSGEERLVKPDPAIFRTLFDRYGVRAAESVFIDDSPKNVSASEALGMRAVLFESPEQLARDLLALGLAF
jgi:2-haloacid dehalogenase